jgi:RNA polymerase sigma factor (sigma-70 family)
MDQQAPAPDLRRMYEDVLVRAMQYAGRMVPRDHALEIAHDVAVELIRQPTAKPPGGPVVYLAVKRRLRDGMRAVERRAAREATYLTLQSEATPVWALPGADLEARELGDRIAQVVGAMPPAMREVFLLVREEQLTYREAAARLGVGMGTVHTQLTRAGALLRECVRRYHADAPRTPSPRKGQRYIAMTDDFQLFPDGSDDAGDADAALIMAYLARELSPVQVAAVEERLATDAAFRESVWPIVEAWFHPRAFGAGSPARRSVTPAIVDAGWQRFLTEPGPAERGETATASLRFWRGQSAEHNTGRRMPSMRRIAAVVALTVLPIVGCAQVVIYAANHVEVPGHAFARAIVPSGWVRPLVRPSGQPAGNGDRGVVSVLEDWQPPHDHDSAGMTNVAIPLTQELRIDGAQHNLAPIGHVAVFANGTVAITQPRDTNLRFFSATGSPLATVGRAGSGTGEFKYMSQVGVVGDSLWVYDLGQKRVTFVSPGLRVLRTAHFPAPHIRAADTVRFPRILMMLFHGVTGRGGFVAHAILRDGGGQSRMVTVDSVGWVQSMTVPVPNAGGRDIVFVPSGNCKNCGWAKPVPFFAGPLVSMSPDALFFGTAISHIDTAPPSLLVTMVRTATGDTVYSRAIPVRAEPIPPRILESARAEMLEDVYDLPKRTAIKDHVFPAFYPPAVALLVAPDGSAWIHLHEPTSRWNYLVLDPKGSVRGMVTVRQGARVAAVRGNLVWVVEPGPDGREGLVRYRVGK